MPIEFTIDHARRLVTATARGTLTGRDIFGYQRADNMRALAELSASMDTPRTSSKFAIVASSDEAFGLGRMYETYRHLEGKGTKQVAVFRTLTEAYAYLGVT